MWAEKQTFGSVAEYDRYKAEILGRVRPRSGTEGKIHNRLLRERMQERYHSPENVRKWNQWKAELEAVGKTPAAMAEELEQLEWIPRSYIAWLRNVIRVMDEATR